MTLTAFGQIFLVSLLLLACYGARGLVVALFISAVCHGPAVVNFAVGTQYYGLTPYNIAAAALALWGLGLMLQGRLDWRSCPPPARRVLITWGMFAGVASLGALLLPLAFAGLTIVGPNHKPSVLQFSLINVVQLANLWINGLMLLVVASLPRTLDLRPWLLAGFAGALAVSLLAGGMQLLEHHQIIGPLGNFWFSNLGYELGVWGLMQGVLRVSWPFSEPSYTSAWFAGIAGACATVLALAHRLSSWATLAWITAGVLALLGMLASLGGSGIAGLAGFSAALLVMLLADMASPATRSQAIQRLKTLLRIGLALLLALMLLTEAGQRSQWLSAGKALIAERALSYADGSLPRRQIDDQALASAWDSLGLGVGLGSSRGSSLMTTLLATMGFPGTLLFVLALFRQISGLWQMGRDPLPLFIAGGTLATLAAMAAGIPDINWPVLWIFLIAGFALLARQEKISRPENQSTFVNI